MLEIELADKLKVKPEFPNEAFAGCTLTIIGIYDDSDKGTINERYAVLSSNGEVDNIRNLWLSAYCEKVAA